MKWRISKLQLVLVETRYENGNEWMSFAKIQVSLEINLLISTLISKGLADDFIMWIDRRNEIRVILFDVVPHITCNKSVCYLVWMESIDWLNELPSLSPLSLPYLNDFRKGQREIGQIKVVESVVADDLHINLIELHRSLSCGVSRVTITIHPTPAWGNAQAVEVVVNIGISDVVIGSTDWMYAIVHGIPQYPSVYEAKK